MRNIMWLVNTHSKQVKLTDASPMLADHLRCWPNIKLALVQRLVLAGLRSIAACLVVLIAGGDYKPTSTDPMSVKC